MMGNMIVRVPIHILVEWLRKLKHCPSALVDRRKSGSWLVVAFIRGRAWSYCWLCASLLVLTGEILSTEYSTRSLMWSESIHSIAWASLDIILISIVNECISRLDPSSSCLESHCAIKTRILRNWIVCFVIHSSRGAGFLEYLWASAALRTA